MKTLITALVLSLSSAAAVANTYDLYEHDVVGSDLNRMMGNDFLYGHVDLNTVTDEIYLELQPAWSCERDRVCTLQLPDPLQLTFSDLEVSRNWCGATKIKSELRLVVGGGTAKVTLMDNADSMCQRVMGMPGTMVMYKVDGNDDYPNDNLINMNVLFGGNLQAQD